MVSLEHWDGSNPLAVFDDYETAEEWASDYGFKRGVGNPSVIKIPYNPPKVQPYAPILRYKTELRSGAVGVDMITDPQELDWFEGKPSDEVWQSFTRMGDDTWDNDEAIVLETLVSLQGITVEQAEVTAKDRILAVRKDYID